MSRTEQAIQACGRWICHSIDILKATMIRLVFAVHATIAIIRIVITQGDYWYLLNMCGVNFLLIELVVTIIKRKGREPKWFSPCFFLYICTMIPPIWFLEIHRINVKLGREPLNQTEAIELTAMIEQGLISRANINEQTIKEWGMEDAILVEISFMFIIILGRWILPRGEISHSALSQLLLVYLSLASDILDLLTLFNEKEIYLSASMVRFVLTVFSLCMLQFALNLTATRGRSFYAEFDQNNIEIHQSAPPVSSSDRLKTLSRSRQFLNKLLPSSSSSSMQRSLDRNQTMSMKPRASTICTLSPPATVFANASAIGRNELQTNLIAIESPTPPMRRPRRGHQSIGSLNSLPSGSWAVSRSKSLARRKSVTESVRVFVRKRSSKFLRSELWSILVTVTLQDGPFFAVRVLAIIVYHVRSFLTYFFTFKNFLILLFQTYRIVAICFEKDEQEQEFKEKINTIRRMSAAASQLSVPLNRKI